MTPPRLPTATVREWAESTRELGLGTFVGDDDVRALAAELLALRAAGDALAEAVKQRHNDHHADPFGDKLDDEMCQRARAWRTARGEG